MCNVPVSGKANGDKNQFWAWLDSNLIVESYNEPGVAHCTCQGITKIPHSNIFQTFNIVLHLRIVKNQMECHVLWHFIWLFTVCKIPHLRFFLSTND